MCKHVQVGATVCKQFYLVVTAKAVELVVSLSSIGCQFHFTVVTVEVIRMIRISTEFQHRLVYDHVAFLTEISAEKSRNQVHGF